MRIEILVPVSTDFRNYEMKKDVNKFKHNDVDINISNLEKGPVSIECDYDKALASKYIIELAENMEKSGVDGIVLYCFLEPALAACKEKLNIPVVGLREASIAIASLLGDNIGLVIPKSDNAIQIQGRELSDKVKHMVSLDLPVLELTNHEVLERTVEIEVQKLVQLGCDVIVFGCGSILGLDIQYMQEKYRVPIVEPIHAAVAVCDYLIRTNLTHSKIAYPYPPEKEIK